MPLPPRVWQPCRAMSVRCIRKSPPTPWRCLSVESTCPQRIRTINQLHVLLRELMAGGGPTSLTPARASVALRGFRPRTGPDVSGWHWQRSSSLTSDGSTNHSPPTPRRPHCSTSTARSCARSTASDPSWPPGYLVADGAIGTVRSVQADLGVVRAFDSTDRIFAHELGGGALLDLGVYLVSFAQMVLGNPTSVSALGLLEPSGVDADASMLLGFDEGATATLMCSLHSPMPGHARIFGATGWIDILPRFHHPSSFVLHRQGHESEQFDLPPLGDGYSHELIETTEAIKAGRTESTVMPLDDTLRVQRVLEDAMAQLGIRFAEDLTTP
jgi:hypothetical protein